MNKPKVYFSNIPDETTWDCKDVGIWRVVAIPRKWWSIKEWKFGFSFMRNIAYWVMTNETTDRIKIES